MNAQNHKYTERLNIKRALETLEYSENNLLTDKEINAIIKTLTELRKKQEESLKNKQYNQVEYKQIIITIEKLATLGSELKSLLEYKQSAEDEKQTTKINLLTQKTHEICKEIYNNCVNDYLQLQKEENKIRCEIEEQEDIYTKLKRIKLAVDCNKKNKYYHITKQIENQKNERDIYSIYKEIKLDKTNEEENELYFINEIINLNNENIKKKERDKELINQEIHSIAKNCPNIDQLTTNNQEKIKQYDNLLVRRSQKEEQIIQLKQEIKELTEQAKKKEQIIKQLQQETKELMEKNQQKQ